MGKAIVIQAWFAPSYLNPSVLVTQPDLLGEETAGAIQGLLLLPDNRLSLKATWNERFLHHSKGACTGDESGAARGFLSGRRLPTPQVPGERPEALGEIVLQAPEVALMPRHFLHRPLDLMRQRRALRAVDFPL